MIQMLGFRVFTAGGGGLMVGPTDGAGVGVGVASCSSLRPPGAAAVAFVVLPPTLGFKA
jgi:hypothetical protein